MRTCIVTVGIYWSLCLAGCSSLATTADQSANTLDGGGGNGGNGSSGSGSLVYVPPKCDQTCQDYMTSYAITRSIWFLYNQNIAGMPGGSVDVSTMCPLGGTAHITGTASGSTDGTTTAHLVFELVGCRNTDAQYTLTFDGVVTMDGNFSGGTSTGSKFTAVVFAATDLEIAGTLKVFDEPAIDEICSVAAAQEGAATTTLDGQVCDREFNSETAFENVGGGFQAAGDGGVYEPPVGSDAGDIGAAGSGSSDCTCYCGWPADHVCTMNSDCPADTSVPGTSVPGVCGCPVGC